MPNVDNPYMTHSKSGVVIKRGAWWTEEGNKLSDEEKEKVLDDVFQKVMEDSSDVVMIPRNQMKQIVDALKELRDMGRMTVKEWMEMDPEKASVLHKIHALAEMPHLLADQCLRMNAPIDKGFPTTAYDAPFVENDNGRA